jgi:lipid-A-disaccharide synthase
MPPANCSSRKLPPAPYFPVTIRELVARMRIFFSVGEPSGDVHGANLVRDLKALDPQMEAFGFGGPRMADAGCRLVHDLTALAVMGIWNVLKNVRTFFRLLAMAGKQLDENKVDAVVLIDYPGFNWWIARMAKRRGIPVFYYGVPQMWAWLPWRVRKLRRLVDHVLCKLPFEEKWFRERGCQAHFVGHPFFDEVCRYRHDENFLRNYDVPDRTLLVLLPGSRDQEVERNLGTLLSSARHVRSAHPGVSIAVACFSKRHADLVREVCQREDLLIDVMSGRTPELISMADACIACSGSVSLELLHYRKPTVIVYRAGFLTWFVVDWILKQTRFITLVNLIAAESIKRTFFNRYRPDSPENSEVPMPEYFTFRDRSAQIARWINTWLSDPQACSRRIEILETVAKGFAEPGASERAAGFIARELTRRSTELQTSSITVLPGTVVPDVNGPARHAA